MESNFNKRNLTLYFVNRWKERNLEVEHFHYFVLHLRHVPNINLSDYSNFILQQLPYGENVKLFFDRDDDIFSKILNDNLTDANIAFMGEYDDFYKRTMQAPYIDDYMKMPKVKSLVQQYLPNFGGRIYLSRISESGLHRIRQRIKSRKNSNNKHYSSSRRIYRKLRSSSYGKLRSRSKNK